MFLQISHFELLANLLNNSDLLLSHFLSLIEGESSVDLRVSRKQRTSKRLYKLNPSLVWISLALNPFFISRPVIFKASLFVCVNMHVVPERSVEIMSFTVGTIRLLLWYLTVLIIPFLLSDATIGNVFNLCFIVLTNWLENVTRLLLLRKLSKSSYFFAFFSVINFPI